MLTGPVACLTNILSLSKTKTHGSPLPPPSSAYPDTPGPPCPVHHKHPQGRAAEAAAWLTDRQPVGVCGCVVCCTEISWLSLLCGSLIWFVFRLFSTQTMAMSVSHFGQTPVKDLHEIWSRHSWFPDDACDWFDVVHQLYYALGVI